MDKPAYYKLLFLFENNKASIEELHRKTGLAVSSIKKYLNILESKGFVRRIDYKTNTFELTEKGRLFREAVSRLIDLNEKNIPEYVITDPDTGTPLPLKIKNYEQLLAILRYKLVEPGIIEEHLKRKYLSEWIRNALGDTYISSLIDQGQIKTVNELIREVERIVKVVKTI